MIARRPLIDDNVHMALKHRILVVADEERTQHQLAVRLGARGYLALFAKDSESAVEVVRREQPRLVLVDMTMPSHKGVQVLERFDEPSLARFPVIALVGAGDGELADLDLELTGAIDAALAAQSHAAHAVHAVAAAA